MTLRGMVWPTGVAALVVAAVLVHWSAGDGDPIGADDRAREEVHRMAPGYNPSREPLWQPASIRQESLLFAGQAAFGLILLVYSVHRLRSDP